MAGPICSIFLTHVAQGMFDRHVLGNRHRRSSSLLNPTKLRETKGKIYFVHSKHQL